MWNINIGLFVKCCLGSFNVQNQQNGFAVLAHAVPGNCLIPLLRIRLLLCAICLSFARRFAIDHTSFLLLLSSNISLFPLLITTILLLAIGLMSPPPPVPEQLEIIPLCYLMAAEF